VEQLLRNRQLRRLAVEPHRVGVDLLDGIRVPEPRGLLRIALVVLVARVDLVEQEALHESEHGGAGLRIEHVLEIPDDVVGRELPAVVPLHAATYAQGPRLEVRTGLPLFDETRARDVVGPGDREVVEYLARG